MLLSFLLIVQIIIAVSLIGTILVRRFEGGGSASAVARRAS